MKDLQMVFLEGLNKKIRVIQHRAYELPKEGDLLLKGLNCVLPAL